MKKVLFIIAAIVLAIVILVLTLRTPKTKETFEQNIKYSMEYISNHMEDSGRFVYKAPLEENIKIDKTKYSSVRHAGVLYSMYLFERYLKDYSYQEKRYISSDYFVKRYVKKLDKDVYAVVSLPSEENLKDEVAKLGGAGLGLAALSNLYPDEKIDINILRGLGNFIVSMQTKEGSFYSNYNLKTKQKDKLDKSKYFAGEAALGLLYLNEVDPSEVWVKTSKNALLYIANKYEKEDKKIPFDHWDVLAIRKLFETKNNTLTSQEKEKLITYSEQLANSILPKQNLNPKSEFFGTFPGNKKLCSLATNMEGLSALYYIVDDRRLKSKIKSAINAGNTYLARYQVKGGNMLGAMPYFPFWNMDKLPDKTKIVRIDYVQHTLSAWVLYSVLK